jgi:hypothetical protein
MIRTLLKIAVGMALLAVVLTGAAYTLLSRYASVGRVPAEQREIISETRTLGAGARAVHLNGPIELTMRQGAVPSLVVRGERRLLGNVETVLEGDTLRIGPRGILLHYRQPLQVTLVLPALERLHVNGSGDAEVNGFTGERVDVRLNGSGNVKFNGRFKEVIAGLGGSGDMEMNGGAADSVAVSLVGSGTLTVVGSCQRFNAEQTGSGDLDAEHLQAETAMMELNGSGAAAVQATRRVEIRLHGSGSVNVHGQPAERIVHKTGSGDVSFD